MMRLVCLVTPFLFGGILACVSPNSQHCGRNAGEQTCAERYPGFEYCNICESERDGCVAEPVSDPNCLPKELPTTGDETSSDSAGTTAGTGTEGETVDPTDGTADPTTEAPTTGGESESTTATTETETTQEPTSEDPTTEEPTSEDPTTEDPTTEDPTTETTEDPTTAEPTTEDPEPMCGNNVLEEGENCDTNQLGGNNCLDFDFGGGMLACDEMCQFDITGCCQVAGGDCQQLGGECCDGLTCNLLTGKCG